MTDAIDSTKKQNPYDAIENKEDIRLIWIDGNINESPKHSQMKLDLLTLCPASMFFTEIDRCVEFIKSVRFEKLLTIISIDFAHSILRQINHCHCVYGIYIYCTNEESNLSLKNEHKNIIDICTDQNRLLNSIKTTMNLIEKHILVLNLFDERQRSTRDLSKETASFLWHQMLLYVLKQMPQDEKSKDDMVNMCFHYYRTNQTELKKINEFRMNYTKNKAIQWYTDECFLYKLLNKALRTENIELLYSFRFFIIDLCDALETKSLKSKTSGCQTFYRGQKISTNELTKLKQNIGSIISINGFFSTSRDINVALSFAQTGPVSDALQTILFQIKADPSLPNVIFADIGDESLIGNEQEVLFNLSSVFKINSIEFDTDATLWKVKLIATDEGADKFTKYLNLSKQQLEESTPIIYFGRLLRDELGQIEQAHKYFKTLLESLPSNHSEISSIYNQIGIVHHRRNELNRALEFYELAYNMRRKQLPHNHPHMAASLYNIGTIHRRKENFQQALDCFQKALNIYDINYPDNNVDKIATIECIGRVYSDKNELDTALNYFNRALNMHNSLLPEQHPNIARCLGAIGWVYKKKGDLDMALKYFQRKLEMEEQCLPPDHPNFVNHLSWIVNIYKSKGDIEKAINFCYETMNKQKQILGENHPSIARTLMSMAYLFRDDDSNKALSLYEQALLIVENSTPPDDQTAFYCLSAMGYIYNKMNMLHDALKCNLKAVECHRRVMSCDHIYFADLLRNIGFCYRNIRNTVEALRYFNESLTIYKVNYGEEHEKVKKIEAQIARLSRTRSTVPRTSNLEAETSTSKNESTSNSSKKTEKNSTTMDLANDRIGCEGAQYLADSLRTDTRITRVNITNNQIGDIGTLYLATALTQNKSIIELQLTNNGIGYEGAQYLADALLHNSTLKSLDVSQNRIGYEGVKYLADVLHSNTTLTYLSLENSEMNDLETEDLSHALSFNTALISLNLRQNHIGDKGAEHIADAFQYNTTLRQLILTDNRIKNKGAYHLANALPYNITLNALILERNQIEDEGALYFCEALRYNMTLTTIDLSYNRISKQTVEQLIDTVRNNTALSIELQGNQPKHDDIL